MIRQLLKGACCVAALLAVSACSDTFDPSRDSGDGGRMLLNVGVDRDVRAPQKLSGRSAASRVATEADHIDAGDLTLKMTSHLSGKVFTYKLADFDPTTTFPIGRYTIDAYYGEEGKEDFAAPYYKGSTEVVLHENEATPVSLTATLANSMVSIVYGEDFKNYFPSYSVEIATSKGTSIVHTAGEERAAYVEPGVITIYADVTKPNGVKGKLKAAEFTAEARNHYVVTMGLGAPSGGSAITVTFNSELVEETVEIDVSDQILLAPAPTLSAVGFASGQEITIVEGTTTSGPLRMVATAIAGVASGRLTTEGASLITQGWPPVVDFPADAENLAKIEEFGIRPQGFRGTTTQMALVDFREGLSKLTYNANSDNRTKFTLTVTDKYNKVSEPMSFTVIVQELTLAVEKVYTPAVNEESMVVDMLFNNEDLRDFVRFEVVDNNGAYQRVVHERLEHVPGSNKYKVRIPIPRSANDVVFRAVVLGNNSLSLAPVTVVRTGVAISYNDVDVFATHATMRILGNHASEYIRFAKWFISTDGTNYTQVSSDNLSGNDGGVKISGLTPGTKYYVKAEANGGQSEPVTFTTEANIQLANGDMEQWSRTKGGTDYWWISYPFAEGDAAPVWNTMNQLTTSEGGGSTNWFNRNGCAYSAISGTIETTDKHGGSYAALIRTVGWGGGNSAIASGSGMGTCENSTAGELYLGKYSDGAQYGIDFKVRPSAVSFWYKYAPKNASDQASAKVVIRDASKNVLATNEFNISRTDAYTEHRLELNYPVPCVKAASIEIVFKSSINDVGNLINEDWLTPPPARDLGAGTYMGSQLYIDDVTLNYD